MAASSSDSWKGNAGTKRVSQPFECVAGTKRVFQPFECVDRVKVNVGCFNLGLHQSQIKAKSFQTSTLSNFRRIVAKGFEEGNLHLLNLCEVGGHKQGLQAQGIQADNIVDGTLLKDEYGTHAVQNYMSIWHNTGDSHPSGTSLTKQDVNVKSLESSPDHPQLVMTTYAVKTHGLPAEGLLIVGQLHIRTPTGKVVSINTKKRVVQEALGILEKDSNRYVLQPIVAILCGDVNLDQVSADACCQRSKGEAMPNMRTQWHTQTSHAARSGDVAFVRGCESEAFDVSIGASYKDRGIRNDIHDFFGVTIAVPLFAMPPDKKLRQVKFAVEELSVEDAAEDSEMNSASVSQPSVVTFAAEHGTGATKHLEQSPGAVTWRQNIAQWQPPAPGAVRGQFRDIDEILACCTDDMGWKTLQHIGRKSPGIRLENMDWRLLLQELWESAIKEGIRCNSGVVQPADWNAEMDFETWQKIVCACELDTVEGLKNYVEAWSRKDRFVLQWMQGAAKCRKPTTDIGGWLADYCNTRFLVDSKQARANVKYQAVSNALYKSLADLIGPFGMSAENSGDVWEQLCWHAFEHDRGAFVLSVIWNTTNRCLDASAAAGQVTTLHEMLLQSTGRGAATEHTSGDVHPAVYTGLTMEEASDLRRTTRPSGLHKAMRQNLQAVAAASEENPYERRREVPPTLPWREYIAFHEKCEIFVGSGIDRFYLYFMPEVDPQKVRGGQLRLNYVAERQDGSVVLLHPGTKPRNDAKPIFLTAREFQLKLAYE